MELSLGNEGGEPYPRHGRDALPRDEDEEAK